MKQTLIMLVMTIFTIITFNFMGEDESIIPSEAIRFRVLANSNSEYDQQIKEDIKVKLQNMLYESLKDTKSITEAKEIILNNMDNYDNTVKSELKRLNYNLPYTIDYGYHYFPSKVYKGITYDEGNYESLLVTLGSGQGDNWWCVLFPPLCLLEANETQRDEVEYKFYVTEIINSFFK